MSNVFFIGIIYDRYTPAVEGQLTRDLIKMSLDARHKYRDMVVVTQTDEPDRAIQALGLTTSRNFHEAEHYIVYKTMPEWPAVPSNARVSVQRDLYQKPKKGTLTVLDNDQNNGYYLPPEDLRAA